MGRLRYTMNSHENETLVVSTDGGGGNSQFKHSPGMRNRAIVVLSAALLLVGCKKPPPPPQPMEVQVITVTTRDVPIYQQWIGTLDGYPNAQIRAQVTGYLIRQDYAEGSYVHEGDLLFEIDPRPFQAVLDQAMAKLAEDKAQKGKTELDVKRFTPLAREKAVSQETLDDAIQANLGAAASIEADQAAIETAKLNLGFCRITSPVDGIAGTAQAQIGNLVGPGTATLTTVSTVDPIRDYFNISEDTYLTFYHQWTNAAQRMEYVDKMKLQLILSDGSTYPLPGKWLFTDRQIDITTGTIQIAATFPNPNRFLRPGQFGTVRAETEIRHNAILIPQRAVTELQGTYQVVIVDNTNAVHNRNVDVGAQIGAEWLINGGLAANDRIVVEGTQRARGLKEGTVVQPEPYNPAPANPPATNSPGSTAKE
jgi:membrane fusion protein, multidrug efflux system